MVYYRRAVLKAGNAVTSSLKKINPFPLLIIAKNKITGIKAPKVTLPQLPKFTLPAFPRIKLPTLPKLKTPAIPKISRFPLPRFKAPAITIPTLNLPKLNKPKFALSKEKRHKYQPVAVNPNLAILVLTLFLACAFVGTKTIAANKNTVLQTPVYNSPEPSDELAETIFQDNKTLMKLVEIEPAAGEEAVTISTQTPPPLPESTNPNDNYDRDLTVEGVLVPQKTTVISSSRDGRIKKINFDDGDTFNNGDILVEYDCDDLKAEMSALESESKLSIKKGERGEKLFKLEIISDFERLDLQNEASKAEAQKRILQARMENCTIKAGYDGRVVNKLANDYEYTRTDRVLMEVASLDNLEVEFLLPSIWLRWINIGAPLKIDLYETGEIYTAQISRIHGEVDPVSQSIQVTAALKEYNAPLLPGMSGKINIQRNDVEEAGIRGYLEQ